MKPRAAVILIQNDKIALIDRHRQGSHYIVFPGGKVEAGETPAEAARRETREELGLEVNIGRMVAEVWYLGNPQYYFLAEASGGRFGQGTGEEMNSSLGSKKGTYRPTWMRLGELARQPVLPKLVAELVMNASRDGWPEATLVVRDMPPDESGGQ